MNPLTIPPNRLGTPSIWLEVEDSGQAVLVLAPKRLTAEWGAK